MQCSHIVKFIEISSFLHFQLVLLCFQKISGVKSFFGRGSLQRFDWPEQNITLPRAVLRLKKEERRTTLLLVSTKELLPSIYVLLKAEEGI